MYLLYTKLILQRYHKSVNTCVPDDRHRELWREFMLDLAKDGHFLVTRTRKICWCMFTQNRDQIGRIT